MKRRLAAIHALLTTLVLALFSGVTVGTATAAPVDGVRCPNGFDTRYDSAQKTMRCERSITTSRPTVCDPSASEYVLYRAAKGGDFCVRPGDATTAFGAMTDGDPKRRPVVCSSDGTDGLRWIVEVDAAGDRDRCRATRVEWIYPSQQ